MTAAGIAACLSASLLLASCEKVIDLDLHTASEKYVIEGNVTNMPGPYQVSIGRTGGVNDAYTFRGVSGARVTLRDDAGNTETLQEGAPGQYQTASPGLQGLEGHTYYLDVSIGDQHYTSSSVMPQRVSLDSLYITKVFNWSKDVLTVVPVFTDPAGKGNCYRFDQVINGALDKTLYANNDDFSDGRLSEWPLLRPDPDSTLHPNDQVQVEMQCIDTAVYKYWFSVDESALGNGSNLPANPVTNIQGGALGYFSAHTSQRRTITVK